MKTSANMPDQASKHTPLAPKGTAFKWKDNTHIPRKPVIKGRVEKEKLEFEVIDTNGNYHERFFHKVDEAKWNDAHWISDANKWRSQAIRRLFKNDPGFQVNEFREKWTAEEVEYLKSSILEKVTEVGRELTGNDWKELTRMHNMRFFGGSERMRGPHANKGGRSAIGLRTKYKRFPELAAKVAKVIASFKDEAYAVTIKVEDEE